VAGNLRFPSVFVQTKAKTKERSLNLPKTAKAGVCLFVRFRLIFAAETAFRPRSYGFFRVKIFQQNPFATKYFSKKKRHPRKGRHHNNMEAAWGRS
jgi:hypothetical protein